MIRDTAALSAESYDVLIIGGGITGSCMALSLARQGVKVALIDKNDFMAHTSSSSSKILHGGIRYLQQFQIHKVIESARARNLFLNLAPHLICKIPFAVPTFSGSLMKSKLAMRAGMLLYETVCFPWNVGIRDKSLQFPNFEIWNAEKTKSSIPALSDLKKLNGSVIFYETTMYSSERMGLSILNSAASAGASVANYCELKSFIFENGEVKGALVTDTITGNTIRIQAKVTVNATGPAISQVNQNIPQISLAKRTTGFSRGMHLVIDRQVSPFALALVTPQKTSAVLTRGGRHIFVLPWRDHSLIGTTSVPHGREDLFDVTPSESEISDFLKEINATLPGANFRRDEVTYAYCGLYPLTAEEIHADSYQGTGEYQVVDHEAKDSVKGLVSVLGAKFTTAVKVSKLAGKTILAKLGKKKWQDKPAFAPLDSSPESSSEESLSELKRQFPSVDHNVLMHLFRSYGADAYSILNEFPVNLPENSAISNERIHTKAELKYLVHNEMPIHLDDLIFRRTGIGSIGHPGQHYIKSCADLMKTELGWSDSKMADEITRVEDYYKFHS